MLKKEVVSVESELEEVRYEASFAGVQSSKEHKKQLAEKQQKLRQIKEKAESMEQLEQKVVAGLAHISDILFIPKSDDDAPVVNLIRDIEAVLDVLINEREKQVQQQQGGGSAGGPRDTTSSAVSVNLPVTIFVLMISFRFRCQKLMSIAHQSWILQLLNTNHQRCDFPGNFLLNRALTRRRAMLTSIIDRFFCIQLPKIQVAIMRMMIMKMKGRGIEISLRVNH